MMNRTIDMQIAHLREVLDKSKYTVCMCGSGILAESGYRTLRQQETAYELENRYGMSPEDIFTSVFYNTRPEQFFDFYRKEILEKIMEPSPSAYALANMEKAGKLQMSITSNIFDTLQRAGCRHVIDLHGSIFHNACPRCGRDYSMDYIKDSKKVPLCEDCKSAVIRPQVYFYGEQINSRIQTQAVNEIEKADVLMLAGTSAVSSLYDNYVKYFEGSCLVMIHEDEHIHDHNADIVIIDQPKNVLPKLNY